MAKVLLVSPPFYRLLGSHFNGISIGLAYISSVLKKNSHETITYNADFSNDDHYLDQKEIIRGFDNYKSTLNDIDHPIWQECRKAIIDVDPDFIGFQMYTATLKSVQIMAGIAKDYNPNIKIVVGGTHPTLDPEGTARIDSFDYIVRGEGEYAMLEIVSGKDPDQIDGIAYKNGDNLVVTNPERDFIKDLDSLPFPSRNSYYSGNGKIDIGAVVTSRGCPSQCTFCASPKIWKKKVRFRKSDNVPLS